MTEITILSNLTIGNSFVIADPQCLSKMGIDADQQPFTIYDVNTPIKEYYYVKDRNGITYLMGPGTLPCREHEDSNQGKHRA